MNSANSIDLKAPPAKATTGTKYALDNAAEQAAERFAALREMFDPGTIRHLEARGVSSGWHCLEVGGGGGSIAAWLSERVGPTGRVVVTDINTRFLESLKRPNLEVLQHDIVADPLPERAFDLVHARLVLMHLPERDWVLGRLVAALKPGGWILDEEFDVLSLRADPDLNPGEEVLKACYAMYRVLAEREVDLRFGRSLFGRLRAHGLTEVHAEGRLFMLAGRSVGASLLRANFEQLWKDMIGGGYISAEELDHDIRRLDDPNFRMPMPTLWAAWGRRPRELTTRNSNRV